MAARGLSWLTLLFRQAFSERQLIEPERYAFVNAMFGAILVLAAAVIYAELQGRRLWPALILVSVGVLLLAGLIVRRLRPGGLPMVLGLHGVVLAGSGALLAGDTMMSALAAPPLTTFRYGPGLILILLTYGSLLLAMLLRGQWVGWVRRSGFFAGLLLELGAAGSLLWRVFGA